MTLDNHNDIDVNRIILELQSIFPQSFFIEVLIKSSKLGTYFFIPVFTRFIFPFFKQIVDSIS